MGLGGCGGGSGPPLQQRRLLPPHPPFSQEVNNPSRNDELAQVQEKTMKGLKEMGAFGLQVPTALGGLGLTNTQVRPVSPSPAGGGGLFSRLAASAGPPKGAELCTCLGVSLPRSMPAWWKSWGGMTWVWASPWAPTSPSASRAFCSTVPRSRRRSTCPSWHQVGLGTRGGERVPPQPRMGPLKKLDLCFFGRRGWCRDRPLVSFSRVAESLRLISVCFIEVRSL